MTTITTITATPDTETIPLTERPVETVKPLKLSEALRLGSMGTKQHRGWHKVDADGNDLMCAMSTAWYALTGHKGNDANGTPLHTLLEGKVVEHPVGGSQMSLAGTIIDLNDQHRWTRPQIADWLESIGL
jgi:hypothetical protein